MKARPSTGSMTSPDQRASIAPALGKRARIQDSSRDPALLGVLFLAGLVVLAADDQDVALDRADLERLRGARSGRDLAVSQ